MSLKTENLKFSLKHDGGKTYSFEISLLFNSRQIYHDSCYATSYIIISVEFIALTICQLKLSKTLFLVFKDM